MTSKDSVTAEQSPQKLFVPSLAVSALSTAISGTIVTLLVLEIAASFQIQEGVAIQLKTINSAGEVVFSFLIGFLTLKIKHKSLLLFGVLLILISATGTFLSSAFNQMLSFSFIEGLGSIAVYVAALALIGDILPLDRKAKAVSWIAIAGFFSTLLGTPTISFIASVGGWRYAFLLLVCPVSVAGLALVIRYVPSLKKNIQKTEPPKDSLVKSFKQVFLNKSSLSCILAGFLLTGGGVSIFAVTFFRQLFLLTREEAVLVIMIVAPIIIFGGLAPGRLANKFGAKNLTIVGAVGSGVCTVMLFFAPIFGGALVLFSFQVFLSSFAISAYFCLSLEQVPEFRGTMMSMTRLSLGIGNTLAPAMGGALLALSSPKTIGIGYQNVGLTLGAMSIVAALFLYFMAKDPFKKDLLGSFVKVV